MTASDSSISAATMAGVESDAVQFWLNGECWMGWWTDVRDCRPGELTRLPDLRNQPSNLLAWLREQGLTGAKADCIK